MTTNGGSDPPSNAPMHEYDSAALFNQTPEKRSRWLIAIPIAVLALWFGYLYFISGVLPSEETYPNGRRKAVGTVKRQGMFQYARSGLWREFHPNGAVAGEGQYQNGKKMESTWEYWNEEGTPLNTDRPAPTTKAKEGNRERM